MWFSVKLSNTRTKDIISRCPENEENIYSLNIETMYLIYLKIKEDTKQKNKINY